MHEIAFAVCAAGFWSLPRLAAMLRCRLLYDVLSEAARAKGGAAAPVVLACNKSDLGEKAFGTDFIVTLLDKEMCASIAQLPCQPPACKCAGLSLETLEAALAYAFCSRLSAAGVRR